MVKQYLRISSLQTASRCWLPTYRQQATSRLFLSRQRCVNFNTSEGTLIANDDVIPEDARAAAEPYFEPSVHSMEEVFTAGPVNKST